MTTAGAESKMPAQVTMALNPQTVEEERAVGHILRCGAATLAALLAMIDRERVRPIIFVSPDESEDD